MKTGFQIVTALTLALAAPLAAAPTTLAIVNATGAEITGMEARRTGTTAWAPVAYAARVGQSAGATLDTEDCAWDIRVTLAGGGTLTYPNVNLCEARLVTLRQRGGLAWIDID